MNEVGAFLILLACAVLLTISIILKVELDELRLQMVQAGCMIYNSSNGKVEVKK